jgi:hypothetical protein
MLSLLCDLVVGRIRRRQLFGERTNVASDSLSNFFRNQAQMLYISTYLARQCPAKNPASSSGKIAAGL